MKDFKDKVAVITGAANGIGRGLAERCAQEGMKVVVADIVEKPLNQFEEELKAAGASVLAVLTDVSKASDMEALAGKTMDAFGAVHLLFNNAGVESIGDLLGPIWESSLSDWERIIGVNLWGIIHGCRVFVPLMLEQDTDCHIVNTASAGGLIASPFMGIYKTTKHGVVSLSETLYHQLAKRGAKVKVSVLCPGSVKTQILDSPIPEDMSPADRERLQIFRQNVYEGMTPAEVTDCVFNAIQGNKFYIFTHLDTKAKVRIRMEDILEEHNPTIT